MTKTRRLTYSMLLLVTLPSFEAIAQDKITKAEELFHDGLTDYKNNQCHDAIPKFIESYKLDPSPGVLHGIGRCHKQLGKIASAANYYNQFLNEVGKLEPEKQQKYESQVNEAKREQSQLQSTIPMVTLKLTSQLPNGIAVHLDDNRLEAGRIEIPHPLDPGDHKIVVRGINNSLLMEKTFRLNASEHQVIAVDLGQLNVVDQGIARHDPQTINLEEKTTSRIPAYLALGVGAVGLGVGAVAGMLVLNQKGTINENCHQIGDARYACNAIGLSEVESVRRTGWISNGGFFIGALSSALGVFLWVQSSEKPINPKKSAAGANLRKWVSISSLELHSTGTTLSLTGAF